MSKPVLQIEFDEDERPIGPADIRERCEALAEHMAALEDKREGNREPNTEPNSEANDQPVATDGGVATADGGVELEDVDDQIEPPLLGDRIERALTDPMAIQKLAPGIYEVANIEGEQYTCDVRMGVCRCPDYQHRMAEAGGVCKHIIRCRAVHEAAALDGGDR